jgi:aldose 1-epimerase
MSVNLHELNNGIWHAGILPDTGASIAFGRLRQGNTWRDVLRSTTEAYYGNVSKASSFIMLPWCNRIRDGILRFEGQEYQLQTSPEDGTARHGDVRSRAWRVEAADESRILLSFDSAQHANVNFPFHFSALAEYRLDGEHFIWRLTLRNEDRRRMPGGFGYHPYFVRTDDVEVLIPCDSQYELVDYLAVGAPTPVEPRVDFRQMRPLADGVFNDLLTHRYEGEAVRMYYPQLGLRLSLTADPLFRHILIYTPPGNPSFAVEPQSNANDGFNLHGRGIPDTGVFALEPGEAISGEVVLSPEL